MTSQTQTHEIDATTVQRLRDEAARVAGNAYAPYSNFHVGAALLLSNGEVVTGCNVENASFRLTNCAEQTAVGNAITAYGPDVRIHAVAVANADASLACQPCGACRQTLAEFADGNTPIYYPGDGGMPGECTLADLLPASFRGESLK